MAKIDDTISDLVFEIRRETSSEIDRVNKTLHVIQCLFESANVRVSPDFNSNFYLESDFGEIDLNDDFEFEVIPERTYEPSFILQRRIENHTIGGLGELIDYYSGGLYALKKLELVENIHDVKLFELVDHILWKDWNPIELDPAPRNEYSGYAPIIYFDVLHRKPIERIANKLGRIQEWNMCLKAREEHCLDVAKKLIEARDNYLGDV
jgi:hypothetical protein